MTQSHIWQRIEADNETIIVIGILVKRRQKYQLIKINYSKIRSPLDNY